MPPDARTRTLHNHQRCLDYQRRRKESGLDVRIYAITGQTRPDVARRNRERAKRAAEEIAWLEFKARSDARAAKRKPKPKRGKHTRWELARDRIARWPRGRKADVRCTYSTAVASCRDKATD
jgi:hypothetical protein